MKTNSVAFLLVFILNVFLCSCSPTEKQKIVITGSSTIAPLISEIGKKFENRYPQIRVDVQTGGSSRGVNDVRKSLSNIGMVSRSQQSGEEDLRWFAIALDGICMIVHQENPLHHLTEENIRALYRGEIKNWKELGGQDAPITLVHKAEGRSTLELFLQYFKLKNNEVQAHVIVGDNQQGIKTVAGNPNAIGYVSIGTAEFEVNQGTKLKLLSLGNIQASINNLKNQTFPLARKLHLVTKEAPQGIQKEFLDYCLSAEVHSLIEEQYFVPIQK